MRKLQLLTFLFASFLMLSLTSCDKDDDDDNPSNQALLTAGIWTAESIKVDQATITKEQIMLLTNEDISTWKIKFNEDGTVSINLVDEAGTGNWKFADNDKTLVLESEGEETRVKVNKLTSSELYLEFEAEDLGDEEISMFGDTFEIQFKR